MSTTAFVITQDGPGYTVVSTAQVGPPGPDGPAGATGPRGSSGLPGTDVDLDFDTNGNPLLDVTTHWWMDTDGTVHYESDPANVPDGKEAWLDPETLTVVSGLPGIGTSSVHSVNGLTGDVVLNASIIGSNEWLITQTQAQTWAFSGASYDGNGALLTANLTWPDGSTGVYTADTVSTAFPGLVDAFHVTWVNGTTTKTVHQPAFTRNASGLITTAPAMTVS